MKVAFIGTGTMGQPMLANLVKKGFQAIAYDTATMALDAAVRLGAERADSAAQAAAAGELVITMLPSSANVEAAYLGAGGIIEGLAAGRLCVDMSTIDPGTSQRVAAHLKERRIRFLDAPVSGGVGGAVAGSLAIMVGGEASDLEEAQPVLAAMGSNIIHVGAVGAGEVAKLCNNLISGAVAVAVSEAFRIGEAFGVDPHILTGVIAKSSGATWVMEHMHPVPGIVDKRRVEPAICTGLYDRPDGQGPRACGQRCPRKTRAGRRGARGPATLPNGFLARARPQGLLVGLPIPQAVER